MVKSYDVHWVLSEGGLRSGRKTTCPDTAGGIWYRHALREGGQRQDILYIYWWVIRLWLIRPDKRMNYLKSSSTVERQCLPWKLRWMQLLYRLHKFQCSRQSLSQARVSRWNSSHAVTYSRSRMFLTSSCLQQDPRLWCYHMKIYEKKYKWWESAKRYLVKLIQRNALLEDWSRSLSYLDSTLWNPFAKVGGGVARSEAFRLRPWFIPLGKRTPIADVHGVCSWIWRQEGMSTACWGPRLKEDSPDCIPTIHGFGFGISMIKEGSQ